MFGMLWNLEMGTAFINITPMIRILLSYKAWGMSQQLTPAESEAQPAASEDNLTRKMASGRETSLKAEGET